MGRERKTGNNREESQIQEGETGKEVTRQKERQMGGGGKRKKETSRRYSCRMGEQAQGGDNTHPIVQGEQSDV